MAKGRRKSRRASKAHRAGQEPNHRAGSSALAPQFLDETIAVWQPLSSRPLNREDAREIVENVTGFFSILLEWKKAELKQQRTTQATGSEAK